MGLMLVVRKSKVVDEINSFQGEYRFLSNFYPAWVTYEGEEYPSTEHAYQAAKTTDTGMRAWIKNAKTPGDAKRCGREVDVRDDWETIKPIVMLDLLLQKFNHPHLKKKLLATGDANLVEGNRWHDNYWGKCNCGRCRAGGLNMLGRLLMKVRETYAMG